MENRYSPRHSTVFHSEISNADTHEVIGHQLNISENGLCMLTKVPYAKDEVLRLELKLPSPCGETSAVTFEAVVCWCDIDTNPDYYDIGLKIIDPDEATIAAFNRIMRVYCFSQ